MYSLQEIRHFARLVGFAETRCRACPPEEWSPACEVCGDSGRVWTDAQSRLTDDEMLARLREHDARSPRARSGSIASP
jgi:hypothetical protein